MTRTTLEDRSSAEPLLGSYFVSAYPPFACWRESEVGAFERRLARKDRTAGSFGLYVHVPFCADRCRYCYYLSHDDRGGEIDAYLEHLLGELELYARRPYLAGRSPSFVYFGGGTPSLLSERRTRTLLAEARRLFDWSGAREVTFECAPRSVTEPKLELLREYGVTRISLGVQQLDDAVLRRNGRVHLVADVARAMAEIHRVGFEVLNVDLIAGLVGETDRSFLSSLDKVIGMEPESVTMYLLEIPHNTPLHRSIVDGSAAEQPPGWEVKRARLAAGFERLEAAGYTVRSAYAAVRDPERHAFLYQDEQYRGADLVGAGVSAFSYLGGIHHQNVAELGAYMRGPRGSLPLWRAYALTPEERLVREVVLQLKLGGFDARSVSERHGVDPLERFAAVLERQRELGYLKVGDERVTVTREGLLRVDRLLREFYLPEHASAAGRPQAARSGACAPVSDPGA